MRRAHSSTTTTSTPAGSRAVAESIRAHRAQHGNAAHLLFSFHGLPQRLADNGDPYPEQCEAGARAIAGALGLRDEAWTLTYQSRFGREKWLEPATADTLDGPGRARYAQRRRGRAGLRGGLPGNAGGSRADAEGRTSSARGGELRYIPCLNDSAAHARRRDLARRSIAGADAQRRAAPTNLA